MNVNNIIDVINSGMNTVSEIESEFSYSRSKINTELKKLVDEGVLERRRDGRSYTYSVASESRSNDGSVTNTSHIQSTQTRSYPNTEERTNLKMDNSSGTNTSSPSIEGSMPVNREYDFTDRIPDGVDPYIPSDNEVMKILSTINNRDKTGKKARFLIGGPTGCGKTHLVKYLADYLDMPLFTIQGKWALDETDLIGNPTLVGDNSWWVDGELTKALLSSTTRPTILLVDEINRVRPDSKGVLYPAFDDRCEVRLDMRGGEVITGNPHNLIVFSTVNEGSGYFTEEMDLAEIRRVSTKHNLEYLGVNDKSREIRLVSERTGINEDVADLLVDTANKIRSMADSSTSVTIGIPTASVISWAQESLSYHNSNIKNPIFEAAKTTVINPYYDSNPDAKSRVKEVIAEKTNKSEINAESLQEWKTKSTQKRIAETKHT